MESIKNHYKTVIKDRQNEKNSNSNKIYDGWGD